jgi:maltose-binding protein MalE
LGGKASNPDMAWTFVEETFLSKQGGLDAAEAGSIPLHAEVAKDPIVTKDPNLSAFATIAGASIANPINPNTGKISDVIGGSWNEFVAGRISGGDAAKKIADGVPPLMES